METQHLIQGSPEWLAYRASHFNASDAPAMMGCSPYKTRAQLLREMHTGVAADVDIATQKRFDNGHRAEALARPLAEEFIGAELYPVTGSLGKLSASFDGLTLDESTVFEHKALNADLRAAMQHEDNSNTLPLHYRVQLEQQLYVSGADRALFMSSAWTPNDELIEERHCWYSSDKELRAAILRGWDQFAADLAAYTLPPPAAESARAEPMDSLPAVSVRLDGALSVAGNLPTFAVALRSFIDRMPTKPATDTEFATCEAACKALKKAEEALDAAEAGALASITDVEAMRRAVADCRKLARDTRLAAERMVERRKIEIKECAVMDARHALDDHIAVVNAEIAPMRLQPVPADFAGAIKGKRSMDSMQDALDTTLAAAKIAADAAGRSIRKNIDHFKEVASGMEALFADLGQLVHKAPEDFRMLVQARVLAQQERDRKAEDARKAAEAARIAAAEQRAREQEAVRIAEQQRQAERLRAEEAARQAAAAITQANQSTTQPGTAGSQVDGCRAPERQPAGCSGPGTTDQTSRPASPTPRHDEPATLTLGMICERLQFTVRADFLADVLHVKPAKVEGKRPGTYTESQFATICHQLQSHVSAMAELYDSAVAA